MSPIRTADPLEFAAPVCRALIVRATLLTSPERVRSSVVEPILMALRSVFEPNCKSLAHNMLGASALIGGINDTPARLGGLRS